MDKLYCPAIIFLGLVGSRETFESEASTFRVMQPSCHYSTLKYDQLARFASIFQPLGFTYLQSITESPTSLENCPKFMTHLGIFWENLYTPSGILQGS